MLGDSGAPELEIERGPRTGTRRKLAPPESALVIGRGDEATWVIVDEDLSRSHAEIRRGWDGVTARDLGSKNGTRLEGTRLGSAPAELHDGATLTLGSVVVRFRDPAERHLRGEPPLASPAPRSTPATQLTVAAPRTWPIFAFAAIAVLALAALIWILAS
jgi:pSer/pThr/pTyr-binding forkhead associated (FHA) protein